MNFPKLLLASSSPRRAELLSQAGILFDTASPEVEEIIDLSIKPEENVQAIAIEKAEKVAAKHHNRAVLAADTIVTIDGVIIGKPENGADARRILKSLSGREHEVMTGVCLVDRSRNIHWTIVEVSAVRFKALTSEEIDLYVATKEPMDKAGGYAIQGGARKWIEEYRGSLSNIIGLPMEPLLDALDRFGYSFVKTEQERATR